MSDRFEGARPILSSNADPIGQTLPIEPPPQALAVQDAAAVQVLTPAPGPAKPVARSNDIIKIAGLGSMVQDVRDQISGLRVELPQLAESARALRSTAGNLRGQIDATHDDLKFEAETLGNGSGS